MAEMAFGVVHEQVRILKGLCPHYPAWASDDKYDPEELRSFLKNFQVDKTKAQVKVVHIGLYKVVEMIQPWKVEAEKGSRLASKVSDAKSSIQFGTNCLAIRSCATILFSKEPPKKDHISNILKACATLGAQVPESIVKAVRALTPPS